MTTTGKLLSLQPCLTLRATFDRAEQADNKSNTKWPIGG
jgi:hypothetical protein